MIRLFVGLVALSCVLATSAAEWVKIGGHEAHPTRVLARLKPAQNLARLAVVAPDADVKRKYSEVPGLVVIELKDQAKLKAAVAGDADPAAALKKTINDLKATGAFLYVEPDWAVYPDLTPTDRRFTDGTLWGLRNTGQFGGVPGADIKAPQAWDISTGDTNMVVAVIDTGVNYKHQDLAAQMWHNPDEIPGNGIDDDNNGFIDDVYGINSILDNGDPLDDNGHGSHCSGTIGAAANNSFEHVGVIWKVQIMALKFLSAEGPGAISDAVQCLNYALSKKVKLSSNSWGGGGYSQAMFDTIEAGRQQGHLFIAAAGNDSSDNDQDPAYPASYDLDNIISVAALDRRDELADFSNYGLKSVDIGAPGVEIFSCWFGETNAYNIIQGTSMACPHVSGAAALSWSTDLTASYSEIRDRILQTAVPIPSLAGKTSTGGRLDAFAAMGGDVDGILELSVLPPSGTFFGVGSQQIVQVKVRDALLVNDATVVGRFNNQTINFLNDGNAPDTSTNDGTYTATLIIPASPGAYTLALDVKAPGKADAHLDVNYSALVASQNDYFARAIRIPAVGGIREGDNRLATPEPGSFPGAPGYGPDIGEPLHAGVSNTRSLWWSWSSPTATPVIIDTAGTSFDDDAVLGVYTGGSVSTLSEVGSAVASVNGPNGTRAPFVKFVAEPTVTYWIAVAQSQLGTNSPGRVTVRVEPNGDIDSTPPIVQVTNILSGTFYRSADNTLILKGNASDPGPSASGVASVQIKGPNDQVFGIVEGTTNWVSQPIQLSPGMNVIEVTGFDRADNQAVIQQIFITYLEQTVSNDLFGYSTTILGNTGEVTGSNTNATKESLEPAHAGNQGGHSVWWNFSPPQDGILFLSTEGSDFDTLLSLYTVADKDLDRSLSKLILVGQSDNVEPNTYSEITATVSSNRIYYIAVDGFGAAVGTVHLRYDLTPMTVFPVTTVALPGGTISPAGTTLFPEGSAVTISTTPEQYRQLQTFSVTITNAQSGAVSSFVTNSPTFTFEVVGGASITAEFGQKVYTDDFESKTFFRLPWMVEGNWVVEQVETNATTHAGSYVARTKNMQNNSVASLVLVTNLLAGKASFEYRISTETNYDRVEFLMDNVVLATWSGEVPWSVFKFDVPLKETGATTKLEWRYTKDFSDAKGLDSVFIDNIDLPLALPPPITLSINRSTFQISVTGPPNSDLQLLSSDNLETWVDAVEATTTPSGKATFNIPPFSGTQRFYKVSLIQ